MSEYSVPEAKCHVSTKMSKSKDEVDGEAVTVSQFRNHITLESGKYYYGVHIKTGSQLMAGTSGCVYVNLIGNKAQTGRVEIQHHLARLFGNEIGRDSTEKLVIVSDADLGEVLVVTVGCDKDLIDDQWYVSFVAVANLQSDHDSMTHFPCYHWLGADTSVSITANTTILKDVGDNKILLQQRAEQLKQRKEAYQWQTFVDTGIPSGIDDSVSKLPPDEQFGAVKNFDFSSGGIGALVALGLENADAKLKCIDDLQQFEKLADALGSHRPLYEVGRWTSDVEFGRQMLNGVNPIVIQRCVELPPNFHVTEEMVKPFLVRGLSLQEEMKNGHVYICNMSIMDGLEPREGHYNVAPICLLYVNGAGQLVPIAIQLKQEGKNNNPIFLPSDHWIDWVRAKIYYQSAHGQYHELLTHYTACHATMEAFAMGIQRNLPDPHPIFKLLRPHIRYTMAINTRARASLINDGGVIDRFFGIGGAGKVEMLKRIGKSYNVHISNIKRSAKERGVDNAEQLPGYYYRDDGFKVWDALEVYAGDIINEFYQSDEDVKGDTELQNWAQDIHTNGFPGSDSVPDGHGFPSSISSREELRELCTLVMFTGSAQHASVNFMQYYIYQYVPNAPFGVRRPPPAEKNKADYQDLLETLPDEQSAINGIGTVHLLSQYSTNEKYLGDYEARFTELTATRLIDRLKKSLRGISGDVLQRNQKLDMPYTGMLPEKVPNSITI